MFFCRIPVSAPTKCNETRPRRILFSLGDIGSEGLSHKPADRPLFTFGQSTEVSFQSFIDEDCRALHMMYDSIYIGREQ